MYPVVCVNDTGINIVRYNVLDPSWLDSVCRGSMLKVQNESDTKLELSGKTTIQLPLGESHTSNTFGVVEELVVSVLLRTTFIDRNAKPIQAA